MANDIICEISSAGEIVVEITGMTYQSVAAELAGKASVEDVELKADKTYVDSQDALKADLVDLAPKADIIYVDSQDALKADLTYVDSQDALKADITYVDTQDALKADKTYVDNQDILKADITYVDSQDTLKADKTYVDSQDALKADKTYVDSQDALKADKTYVDSQDALKADKTYVDSQDALKADLTDIGLLEASLSENKIYQAVKDSSDDTLLDSSGNIIEGTVIFVNAQEAYDLKARISILETLVMSIFSEMSPNQIAVLFSMIGATNVNVSLLETHAILDSDY